MRLKKMFAFVCSLVVGMSLTASVEAGFGLPKVKIGIGGTNNTKKTENVKEATVGWDGWSQYAWSLDGANVPSNARMYQIEYTDGGNAPSYSIQGNKVIFNNVKTGRCMAFGNSNFNYINAGAFRGTNPLHIIVVYPGVGFEFKDIVLGQDRSVRSSSGNLKGSGCTMFDGLIK